MTLKSFLTGGDDQFDYKDLTGFVALLNNLVMMGKHLYDPSYSPDPLIWGSCMAIIVAVAGLKTLEAWKVK